jgi:two-component system, cell cycle sensor histidine kinase and response regulator CckA
MADVSSCVANGGPELQENLRAVSLAQKTELVGQIAGAIAHQFNNIMMAITSYADLELKKAAPPQKRSLELVLSNAARATSLIQKLLAFTCKHVPSPQPLSINSVITELDGLLRLLVGEATEISLGLDPKIQIVKADHIEIQQIILSLALSATNATADGGKLTVSTEVMELDKAFVGTEGVPPGKYVMLSLNHRGPAVGRKHTPEAGGSDPNLAAHLALTAVRGMVKQAQGVVRVSTSPQNGSTFQVYFPALDATSSVEQGPRSSAKERALAKTILVVDDDDAVRVPAAEFLMMEGFKVLQAKTGPEAIQTVESHRSSVDLLITDIVMPAMSGREVASKLLAKCPDLKVLYMSGDTKSSGISASGSQGAILQKPFRLNILNDKIRLLLKM